jgi:hypothetical protein
MAPPRVQNKKKVWNKKQTGVTPLIREFPKRVRVIEAISEMP